MYRRSNLRAPVPAAVIAGLAASVLVGGPAAAQESTDGVAEPELGWAATAELSFVATGGNADTSSLGLRAGATRTWTAMRLELAAGALRVEQTRVTRRAIGRPDAVVLVEDEVTERSAENAHLRAHLQRDLGDRLVAFGAAGWERDEPAGISDRLSLATGLGQIWLDGEDHASRTTYGLTYTWEETTAGGDESFAGLRLGWDYLRRLTPTTVFTSTLLVDENLEETSDLRLDELASLAVAMTARLALKASAQLRYDAEPALVAVPREEPAGVPTGETFPVPLDELDTILSAALVVTF